MFNMQKYGLFDETQEPLFRKCIMFYAAIASETVPEHFDLDGIGSISARKIRTDLTPVLRRGERFDLASAQKQVKGLFSRDSKTGRYGAVLLAGFCGGKISAGSFV